MYRIPGFSMTPQQIKNIQSETKQEPLEQTQWLWIDLYLLFQTPLTYHSVYVFFEWKVLYHFFNPVKNSSSVFYHFLAIFWTFWGGNEVSCWHLFKCQSDFFTNFSAKNSKTLCFFTFVPSVYMLLWRLNFARVTYV